MLVERDTRRSGSKELGPLERPHRLLSAVFLLVLTSCRIYREDPSAGPGAMPLAQPPAPNAAGGAPGEGPSSQPAAPSAESLSLWVLNRSENDLKGQAPEGAGPGPAEPPAGSPAVAPARVLVVLGIGPEQPCAEKFAQRALEGLLLEGKRPDQAVSALLDELRRFRWPLGGGALQAAQGGSDGSFGAIYALPPAAFSTELLAAAVRRHGVIDGQSTRFADVVPPVPSLTAAAHATLPCPSPATRELRGPAAVLMRSATGEFYGGLIEVTGQNDAGLLSATIQRDVSLALGQSGGVALVSNCPSLPPAAWAESIRRQLEQGVPPVTAPSGECQSDHALITRDEAWVSSAGSLAWAAVAAPDPAERRPLTPQPQPPVTDAGASAPEGSSPR